jgi:hypothetical protein
VEIRNSLFKIKSFLSDVVRVSKPKLRNSVKEALASCLAKLELRILRSQSGDLELAHPFLVFLSIMIFLLPSKALNAS